jgi:hypothetical protein
MHGVAANDTWDGSTGLLVAFANPWSILQGYSCDQRSELLTFPVTNRPVRINAGRPGE